MLYEGSLEERLAQLLGTRANERGKRTAFEEGELLEAFSQRNAYNYSFSEGSDEENRANEQVFENLLHLRFNDRKFAMCCSQEELFRVLQALRVFLRDHNMLMKFIDEGDFNILSHLLANLVEQHFSAEPSNFQTESLVECTSIVKKLTTVKISWQILTREQCHLSLTRLLRTNEGALLPLALLVLIDLTSENTFRRAFEHLRIMDALLHILEQHEPSFKRLGAELLRHLTRWSSHRREFVDAGGIRPVLPLLHSKDEQLLCNVVNALSNACQDSRANPEIRRMGGIPLVLSLLGSSREGKPSTSVRTLCATCGLIARLAVDDENSSLIVKHNGVYLLGRLLVLDGKESGETKDLDDAESATHHLRCCSLRAMRILFSVERNRKMFKLLFPPDLFAEFIDIGHYVFALEAYEELGTSFDNLSDEAKDKIQEALEEVNSLKQSSHKVAKNYALVGKLGSGAFGTIWQGQKEKQERQFAVKEFSLQNTLLFGETKEEVDNKLEDVQNEVSILAEMDHPNIVRYFESFREGSNFYIVMELVEGISLYDCIMSSREKGKPLQESLVWHVVVQTLQALYYLHYTKGVIHRDITPGNIMLDRSRRSVKIADFGLAKEKGQKQFLQSAVGTLTYNCPEIVQHHEYSEKADVWSLGCVLYHLLALRPPFESENPLLLANRIVKGLYAPLSSEVCSGRLANVVHSLLKPIPSERPSTAEVASMIAPELIGALDRLTTEQERLLESLMEEKERRRKQNAQALRTEEAYKTLLIGNGSVEVSKTGEAVTSVQASSPPQERKQSANVPEMKQNMTTTLPPLRVPSGRSQTKERNAGSVDQGEANAASTGATLAPPKLHISSNRLKPLTEPYAELLSQLHKLVYADQLPPSVARDTRRRCIERYKRYIFSTRHTPGELKSEVMKLASGSKETIELDFGLHEERAEERYLRYRDMRHMLEELLTESGFYEGR